MDRQWSDFFAPGRGEESKQKTPGEKRKTLFRINFWVFQMFFLFLFTVASAFAKTDQISSQFLLLPSFDLKISNSESSAVKVGDRIELKVMGATDLRVAEPIEGEAQVDKETWAIHLEEKESAASLKEGVLVAVPLKPGKLSLPSLPLKDAQGQLRARTNPIDMDVASGISDHDPQPQQPAELEPPVGLKFPLGIAILLGICGVLAITAISYGIYRWWKRHKPPIVAKIEPPRSEDEIALESLEALVKQDLLSKGMYKLFYFRMSEILKTYLGAHYRIDALESTTEEMFQLLEDKKVLYPKEFSEFQEVFVRLDRVKFTDHRPETSEPGALLERAKAFILSAKRSSTVLESGHSYKGVEQSAT